MIHAATTRGTKRALALLLTLFSATPFWLRANATLRQPQCQPPNLRAAGSFTESGVVGVVTGDFTGDGAPDVAVVNRAQRRITIFNGDGQGGFTRGRNFTVPEEPLDARAADFNGDGRPDLLLLYKVRFNAEEVEQLALWMTTADGTLSQTTLIRLPETIPLIWLQLAVADFNGDRATDIALGNNYNPAPLRLYFADGGTLTEDALPFRATLLAGDVNGDGRADLVYTQFEPGRVFVQVGRAGGFFAPRQTVFTADSVVNSAALLGDGPPDILCTTGERSGGGMAGDSFQLHTLHWGGNGFNARHTAERRALVLTGDANGDLRPDAILDDGNDSRAVALNDGQGGFCAAFGYNPLRGLRLFADFNRDGRADALTQTGDTFSAWLNQGGGANTPPTITPASGAAIAQGGEVTLRLAAVSDAETPANRLRVEWLRPPEDLSAGLPFINDGAVLIAAQATCSATLGERTATLKVTDEADGTATAEVTITVNANAAPAVQSAPTRLTLQEGISETLAVVNLPGNADPGAAQQITYSDPGDLVSQTLTLAGRTLTGFNTARGRNAVNYFVAAPAGEHQLRLTLTDRCGAQTIREIPVTVRGASLACGYTAFEPARVMQSGGTLTALAVADFNNDGKADVALADASNNRLKVLLGQANGELRAAAQVPVRRAPYSLAAADFNRDGKLDLAVSNYRVERDLAANERGVSVFTGNGDGTFALLKDYDIGHGALAAGDFNRDGAPDIAVAEVLQQRDVRVLLNDGRGNFTERTPPSLLALGNQAGLVAAYINRDDALDLASNGLASAFGRPFYPLLGDGTGGFAPDYSFAAYENYGDYVNAGDFDGDGKADLAVSFFGADAGPTLDTNSLLLLGQRYRDLFPQTLAAADFNRDGKPDVALSTGGVLLSGPPGPFCAVAQLFAPGRPGAGDFNGDGKMDVLIAGSDGRVSLYLNRTGQPTNAPALTPVAALTRTQGSLLTNAVTVATVNDAETPRDALTVTVVTAPPGLTISNLTNTGGVITAAVNAACTAPVGTQTVLLRVTDAEGAATTASLIVNIASNAPPTLGEYPSLPVAPGSTVTVTPTAPPRDDGVIESVTVSAFAFTTLSINPTTGVVTITNAGGPTGNHTIGVQVRDNCGALTNRYFGVTLAQPLANVSAASYRGPELASEQIATAFGGNLAMTTQAATTLPLPTTLAGMSLFITDSAGVTRPAPLFFVSPTQINYQIPPGTAPGLATALVNLNPLYGVISMGVLRIVPAAPGLFTADASGSGPPVGVALRVKADGTQTSEALTRFDASANRFVPVAIDLGAADEQVFLILYGTGVRGAAGKVTLNVGGLTLTPAFAGAQGTLVGVDQINVQLPRTLAGRGEVELGLSAAGVSGNAVRIAIK